MGLRVNTNLSSLSGQRQLSDVARRLNKNFSRLSSGLRIATVSDDPAGLGLSERMRSQILSLGQAARNSQDGVSLVQTAEGALHEAGNNLTRMRELAVAAANGTYNSQDRATLNAEFNALIEEIDRLSSTTTFNGVNLLDSPTGSIEIQVGTEPTDVISLGLADTTSHGLGLEASGPGATFDLTTATGASSTLATIDEAILELTAIRGELGAAQNRMESAIRSLRAAEENLSAAESRIRDVDVAEETADLTRNSILQQAAASVLSQANLQPQIALSLLQG